MRKTAGAVALHKILRKQTQTAVAGALGISPSTISRCAAGMLSPGQPIREGLERLYGIKADLWETPRERQMRDRIAVVLTEAPEADKGAA